MSRAVRDRAKYDVRLSCREKMFLALYRSLSNAVKWHVDFALSEAWHGAKDRGRPNASLEIASRQLKCGNCPGSLLAYFLNVGRPTDGAQ